MAVKFSYEHIKVKIYFNNVRKNANFEQTWDKFACSTNRFLLNVIYE